MDYEHNLVIGCPLCNLFTNTEDCLVTRLYYPKINKINQVDFIIIECNTQNVPMVVVRDHIPEISNKIWGDISYKCHRMFGKNCIINQDNRRITDHWHCRIYKPKEW